MRIRRCSAGEGAHPPAVAGDGQRRGQLGTYLLRGGDVALKTGCDGAVSQQCFVKLLSLLVLVCFFFSPL